MSSFEAFKRLQLDSNKFLAFQYLVRHLGCQFKHINDYAQPSKLTKHKQNVNRNDLYWNLLYGNERRKQ